MKSALDIALYFLKFRARSVFEIKQKLKLKKIDQKEIDKTLDVLVRNELLDDAKFAKMYVADRNRFKPSGTFVLKMELKKLGIADHLIEEVLTGQDEEALARQAIESKHRYREAEFEQKAQFLRRRGFGSHVIFKVLKGENESEST